MEPPTKRLRRDEDKNKMGWFDLPYEMRRMILDTMEIEELINFSTCSKQCSKEVYESKNYFKEIHLYEDVRFMEMKFTSEKDWRKKYYTLHFTGYQMDSSVIFRVGGGLRKSNEIEGYKRRNDLVLDWLQLFLRRIGKNLKVLRIDVKPLMRNKIVRNVEIKNLKKLVELTLRPCYSQKTCPLNKGFVDMMQLSYVKEHLEISGMIMTFERLIHIKSDNIRIYYTNLTPKDLNKYIRMWMNGELHENFKSLEVRAAYNIDQLEREIELDLDELGIPPPMCRYQEISFTLKSSCESLKHLTAYVSLFRDGMNFEFKIKKNE